MNIQKAAAEMRQVIERSFYDAPLLQERLSYAARAHLLDMLRQIEAGTVTDTKAHRWLGWAQACVYVNGAATLDELKALNKRS